MELDLDKHLTLNQIPYNLCCGCEYRKNMQSNIISYAHWRSDPSLYEGTRISWRLMIDNTIINMNTIMFYALKILINRIFWADECF